MSVQSLLLLASCFQGSQILRSKICSKKELIDQRQLLTNDISDDHKSSFFFFYKTYSSQIGLDLPVCAVGAMDEEGGIEEGEELVDKDNEDNVLDVAQAGIVEICLDHLGGRAGQDGGDWHCVLVVKVVVVNENENENEKEKKEESEGGS